MVKRISDLHQVLINEECSLEIPTIQITRLRLFNFSALAPTLDV